MCTAGYTLYSRQLVSAQNHDGMSQKKSRSLLFEYKYLTNNKSAIIDPPSGALAVLPPLVGVAASASGVVYALPCYRGPRSGPDLARYFCL